MTQVSADGFGAVDGDDGRGWLTPTYWKVVLFVTLAVLFYQALVTVILPYYYLGAEPPKDALPPEWVSALPRLPDRWWPAWEIPAKEWLTAQIEWLKSDATVFGIPFKDITRGIGEGLKAPVKWAEYVLYRGHENLPWLWLAVALTSLAGVYAGFRWAVLAALILLVPLLVPLIYDAPDLWFVKLPSDLSDFLTELDPRVLTRLLPAEIAVHFESPDARRLAGPIPWLAIAAGMVILGHWIGGWRLALLCFLTMIYLATFNVWKDAMRTMTIVVVAVPLAVLIGTILGIWVTRSKLAAKIITPIFDLMQAVPHMAYLAPVAALFALGPVTALIATVIFAMPPMARCTILGLQTVPPEIIESGQMSGCTKRQSLWKVALPSGKRTLMLGVNQVVMQTFAMVVIASIAGAQGLGHKLLYSLQQLKLGTAIELGIAISVIAIVLDRLTQGYANKETDHFAAEKPWARRHGHMLTFLAILIGSYVVAIWFRDAAIPPSKLTFTGAEGKITLFDPKALARWMDAGLRQFNKDAFGTLNPIRDWATLNILLPARDFFLWLPWPVFVFVVGAAAWRFGKWPVLLLCLILMASFIVTGFWVPTMKTTYLVLIAATLSVLIGVPLGILAAYPSRFLPMLLTGVASIELAQQLAQSGWLPAVEWASPWVMVLLATIAALVILFAIVPVWLRETIIVILAIKQICDIVIWIVGLVLKAVLGIAGPILTANGVDVSEWGTQIGTLMMYGPWALAVALIVIGAGSELFTGSPLANLSTFFEPITRVIMVTCDTLQTFPSFIYLIPAIMLFRVGDFANVFAIIPYAMVPAVRYTYLGLKRIPPVTIEAAIANGTTPRQRLWKVELPIAIPEIMLGLNQTIMMALAMTAITALIGSTDLGQEVVRSISTQNFGRGILAGFFIAALGIMADRIIGSWAAERKKQLGVG